MLVTKNVNLADVHVLPQKRPITSRHWLLLIKRGIIKTLKSLKNRRTKDLLRGGSSFTSGEESILCHVAKSFTEESISL